MAEVDKDLRYLESGMDLQLTSLKNIGRAAAAAAASGASSSPTLVAARANKLREGLADYIRQEHLYKDSVGAIKTIEEEMASKKAQPEGNWREDFVRRLDDKYRVAEEECSTDCTDVDVAKHPKMIKFELWLLAIQEKGHVPDDSDDDEACQTQEGDDVMISEATAIVNDPITRLPMRDPVRNTLCGHSYERNSILELIEKNPHEQRCPYVGCSNHSVTPAQLESDRRLKRLLIANRNK